MMRGKAIGFARPDAAGTRRGAAIAVRATGDRSAFGAVRVPIVLGIGQLLPLANRLARCGFRAEIVRCPARLGALAELLPCGRNSRRPASRQHPGAAAGETTR
ncbi:hypothetical protein IFM12275_04090 [Nocardia sputorum]|nr:hypothetical protein IFM12275_04090 [Nocardia sputorum]